LALHNLRILQLHSPADLQAELQKIDAGSLLLRDQIAQGTFRRDPATRAEFFSLVREENQ
jgi:hypothetical protein